MRCLGLVEWQVVDEGLTDGTSDLAHRQGVDNIVRLDHNPGLPKAFMIGLKKALRQGADVIVNTYPANQNGAEAIAELTRRTRGGMAAVVIGSRPISDIAQYSAFKRMLRDDWFLILRTAAEIEVPDAPYGFRAFHCYAGDTALGLEPFNLNAGNDHPSRLAVYPRHLGACRAQRPHAPFAAGAPFGEIRAEVGAEDTVDFRPFPSVPLLRYLCLLLSTAWLFRLHPVPGDLVDGRRRGQDPDADHWRSFHSIRHGFSDLACFGRNGRREQRAACRDPVSANSQVVRNQRQAEFVGPELMFTLLEPRLHSGSHRTLLVVPDNTDPSDKALWAKRQAKGGAFAWTLAVGLTP